MLDLILCILCFNVLLILFKFFTRFGVDNLQAIVVNYAVAGTLGILHAGGFSKFDVLIEAEWMPYSVFIGAFFILTFLLLAIGTQKIGMAISSVANKMSVVVPVLFTFFLYGDEVTALKISGIALALVGVYLTATNKQSLNFDKKYVWMIVLIFLGQGIADVIFNYAEKNYVQQEESGLFICGMFFSAGLVGLLIATVQLALKKSRFDWRSLLWGIALGVPNYFTVHFFFSALKTSPLEDSQVYPIYNVGVILCSALIGFFLFREKLSLRNWIGIGLSVVAIAAVGLG